MARIEMVSVTHEGDRIYITQECEGNDDDVVVLSPRQIELFIEMLREEVKLVGIE